MTPINYNSSYRSSAGLAYYFGSWYPNSMWLGGTWAVMETSQLDSHTARPRCTIISYAMRGLPEPYLYLYFLLRSLQDKGSQFPNRGLNWRHFHTFLDEDNMKWLKCSLSQLIVFTKYMQLPSTFEFRYLSRGQSTTPWKILSQILPI